ncbi:MAG: hypothetical protein ACREP1_12045 [Rhodanobacteraceae bacterium]
MSEPSTPNQMAPKHELRDVQAWSLALFAGGLAAMIALVCLFLIWLFGYFERLAERRDPRLSPLAESQAPPAPRLQTRPSDDLAAMRAAEDRALGGYRWLDKEQGLVQIPIERAIDLLAEEGLPKIEVPESEEPQR